MVNYDVDADQSYYIHKSESLQTIIIARALCFLVLFIFRQKKNYSKSLGQIAYYDNLTGLPNLEKFKIDAKNTLLKNQDKTFLVAISDIQNFSFIIELYGFKEGNNLLKIFSESLKKMMNSSNDIIGRSNADTFTLLLDHVQTEETAVQM